MARNLTSIPDITPANAEYPNGRIQNEDPPVVGTPVIEELYGDIIQFFHKLMRLAGLSHNGIPDSETNGFQFISALGSYVRTILGTDALAGVWRSATNAETQAGLVTNRVVTPAGLESKTATETRKGIIELATNAETVTGTDATRAITPAGLHNKLSGSGVRGLIAQADITRVDSNVDTDPGSNPLAVPPTQLNRVLANTRKRVLDIGTWNMDTTSPKSVAHGLSFSQFGKIVNVNILIASDGGSTLYPLYVGGYYSVDSNNVVINRTESGFFDNTQFNDTVTNRGSIVIEYTL